MATDERLQRLLGGAPLAQLRRRLRQRFERDGAGTPLQSFRIERLTEIEHAALAALQGRPARFSASMQIDVDLINTSLRQANIADSLRAALEQLDGRIIDRAAEREAVETQWRDLIGRCTHPDLASLLQMPSGIRLFKRLAGPDHALAARMIAGVEAVLRPLPVQGMTRAQLAANILGDAHALDAGCAIATLVLAVLRATQSQAAALEPDQGDHNPDEMGARELWAGAGVLVNELARPALVLNLPGLATSGEPVYLSLRRLLRTPPEWAVKGRTVHVCENPNLLAIAADRLGKGCAPLVCTEGMPAAAQRTLLGQLARAGAALRYHGDFDWPGLRIANHVMHEHGALPWRFAATDYQMALTHAPTPGRRLQGVRVEASWDEALATIMAAQSQAIDEEMVAESLLGDLALHRG